MIAPSKMLELTVEPLRILRDQLESVLEGLVALAPNLAVGLVLLLLTWLVAWFGGFLIMRVMQRSRARPSLVRAIKTLFKIVIWIVGSAVVATIIFPNLTPTKLLAGLGIGSIAVGLAFKDIFENFLAGLLILIRKPMRIGDDIDCQDVSGRVEEITIRDTHIRQRSGELILVPNSYLFKNPVTVLTDRMLRRIEVIVGVAYGEDVDQSREVIAKAVSAVDSVNREKNVDVFAHAFSSSSIDFRVRWWTGSTPIEEHRSRDQVVAAIKAALNEAGIEIPFPYRTLTFKDPLKVDQS